MAKSYKTAFIRVTSENIPSEGDVVYYNKLDIENILKDWSSTANITYWLIEHVADEEITKTHFHIVIRFKSPTPFENIKSKFPYGMIENAKNVKACIQYLIHMNDDSKVQYKWEDIVTNCDDMTPYKVQSASQQEVTIQKVMEGIDKGVIREYNQFQMIPIELWAKHKTRIENALTYYKERICMDKHREITVMFFSGDTGTGKTSMAKDMCEKNHKSYCVSSSSNDPMQDYKGEDVLILDDLRDTDFKFVDLLKILDNHTKSTVKSRYHNKAFIGDTIIITSHRPLADWYFEESRENKAQLHRRIRYQTKFTVEKLDQYEYNEKLRKYEFVGSAPNIVMMDLRAKAKMAMKMFDAIGIKFSAEKLKEANDMIDNMTLDDLEKMDKQDIKDLL